QSLAAASLSDVLTLWKGLGYYSRARNLHKAAQQIALEHGGELPQTARELERLPGFGRYTAGAVASIAFGERTPVVDGNVFRVLSRLCALKCSQGQAHSDLQIWSIASQWLDEKRPGDWNQGLMELGATVCRPDDPLCLICPVASNCEARHRGLQSV